jgi:hypothetical protein
MLYLENSKGVAQVVEQQPSKSKALSSNSRPSKKKERKKTEEYTQKTLALINKSSKVAGYKINIQNCVLFYNTNNENPKSKLIKQFYSQ